MPQPATDDIRLAEYAALREEELHCIDAQRDLVRLNITASGAVAALAIADAAKPGLLIVLAFLSPVLGLLWIDLDRRIHLFAKYVDDELWTWEPGWEPWLADAKSGHFLPAALAHGVPSIGVFLLPAVAGLIVAASNLEDIGGGLTFGAGCVALALYVVFGLVYLKIRSPVSADSHPEATRESDVEHR